MRQCVSTWHAYSSQVDLRGLCFPHDTDEGSESLRKWSILDVGARILPTGLTIMLTTISIISFQSVWPWWQRRGWQLCAVLCRILLPLLIPHPHGPLGECFLQHVYDPGLCAWLSCLTFLFLSNGGKSIGNNLMHMKRKQGVTNKIKFKHIFF